MVELLSYAPIQRGFLVLIAAGFAFPIVGTYLLRMNLLPLRFMLMHGALLGGAMALALKFNPLLTVFAVNLLLVFVMSHAARSMNTDPGQISAFLMVCSISLAFIFIYRFQVPAKDTLSLLWGSLFTITPGELVVVWAFSLGLIGFHLRFHRQLLAIFFDREIAWSSGVNEQALSNVVILITAVTVAMAMKLIGALLVDALLLLPAIIASFFAKSLQGLIVSACLLGGSFCLGGFFLSLAVDVPVISAVAILATGTFFIIWCTKKRRIP